MFKLVRLQFLMLLVGVLVGALMAGLRGAISAGVGGVACWLPTAISAGCLTHFTLRGPLGFVVGEALKILLVLLILLLVWLLWPTVHWAALLTGLVITLQANFLVFLVKP